MDEKQGLFEVARGGVLFFDEVAELPLEIQAKLLDVLERGEFRRVGSTEAILIQCRMIFATNRDLWSMVKKDCFARTCTIESMSFRSISRRYVVADWISSD